MERRISKLTTTLWGCLTKHPKATYQYNYGLQTKEIRGKIIEEAYADLRKFIYENIIELKKSDIERIEKNFEARLKFDSKTKDDINTQQFNLGEAYNTFQEENYRDLDEYYKEFEKEETKIKEDISLERKGINLIDIRRINLIKVDETTEIDARIYPKSYLCPECKYYVIFDDNYMGELLCPICKSKNKKYQLQQCNYLYICPICANIEQVAPFWEYGPNGKLRNPNNRPFKCLDPNCKGYLRLILNEKYLGFSYWSCSICDIRYKKYIPGTTKEYKVYNFHHDCKIYDRTGDPLPVQYMFNRNSARTINPLIFEYLTIGDQEISFPTLKSFFDQQKNENKQVWELENLELFYKNFFKTTFNVENVFLVQEIKNQTCCFGYESNSQDEKYLYHKRKQFFKTFLGEYNIFFYENKGNGFVIKLDKIGIIKKLIDLGEIEMSNDLEDKFNSLINKFLEHLEKYDLQDLLNDHSPEVKLYKAIHYFSHVILENIIKKIGIDVFRYKLLLRDGAILIYEEEKVLSGGLVQLTLKEKSENVFFSLFCYDIKDKIENCNNDCEDYCQKCAFINDFYCRPIIYFENNGKKWLPPNSLLSRKLAKEIILK